MEKQMIKSVRTVNEKKEIFILNYHLTSEKRIYGILVEKLTEAGILLESEYAGNVGCSRKQMLDTVSTLARNTVTPVSLCEVLDDLYEEAVEKALNTKNEIA